MHAGTRALFVLLVVAFLVRPARIDGNLDPCDGCDSGCELEPGFVCGDGVTSTVCGEQCDDGNADLLDGCTPACVRELVAGGNDPRIDCLSAWSIDNPANEPALDRFGAISAKQVCVDDDPRCDFDGGVAGACTFHLRACANSTNLPACSSASRLSAWEVLRPSAKQAAKSAALAQVRASLLPAVPAALVGPNEHDICTAPLSVVVPLRATPGGFHPARLKLQTRAQSYAGTVDKDVLRLVCLPAS